MTPTSGPLEDEWRAFCDELGAQATFDGELGLEAIQEALAAELHPEMAAPAISVAGTNGKGGTAAFAAGILQAHGRRVGLYTSPHLIDPAERFRIDGHPASRGRILEIGGRVLERYGPGASSAPRLSYFELTTLLATLIFEEHDVDAAVYEVGLGGRYDAVNAIEPTLGVITDIDTDHTEYLGETIDEIAREKGGIARPNRPLILGRQTHRTATETLVETTPARPLEVYGRDFDDSPVRSAFELDAPQRPAPRQTVPWTKSANAATAFRACAFFLDEEFDHRRALSGIRQTRWPGRFDWRQIPAESGGWGLFDAAHNTGAVETLFDQLPDWTDQFGAIVCGGMADKPLETMFARLSDGPPVWGATLASDRAAGSERLEAAIPAEVRRDVLEAPVALQEAARRAGERGEAVLVFGSVYLVGACFEAMGLTAADLTTYDPS